MEALFIYISKANSFIILWCEIWHDALFTSLNYSSLFPILTFGLIDVDKNVIVIEQRCGSYFVD